MAEETAIVVRESQEMATVQPHKTRAMILSPLGIPDDPSKSLSQVIKGWLKDKGFKADELTQAYYRILREDTAPLVAIKIQEALSKGWLQELRTAKLDAKGNEKRFSVTFFAPKAPRVKAITKSQEEKIMALFGGKDSALGKQVLENLRKGNMLTADPVVNVEATPVVENAV